jgi:hypothetical protein
VAERALGELRAPINLGELETRVNASIGIALGSSAQDHPGKLLRQADLAANSLEAGRTGEKPRTRKDYIVRANSSQRCWPKTPSRSLATVVPGPAMFAAILLGYHDPGAHGKFKSLKEL